MAYIGPSVTRKLVKEVSSRWNADIMTAIAGAESTWNTTAHSPTDDWGLFQINRYWHADLFRYYKWNDAYQNTEMAWRVWQSQHYHAWSTYNNGRYLKFMKGGSDISGPFPGTTGFPLSDDALSSPPGPGGLDYSHKVRATGMRGKDGFHVAQLYGRWLRSLR